VTQHSDAQDAARTISSYLAQKWKVLTADRRQAWRDMAALYNQSDWTGGKVRLHGQAAYVKANWLRVACGEGEFDDPRGSTEYRTMVPFTLVYDRPDVTIEWDYTFYPFTTGLWIQVSTQGPISVGRAPDIHWAKHYLFEFFASGGATLVAPASGLWNMWIRTFSVQSDFPTSYVLNSIVIP
jgi:hypothetical protein